MRIDAHRAKRLLCCLSIVATLVLAAGHARADVLGLTPGAYDVTLTCVIANCGGPFTGLVTIVGADATSWLFHTAFDSVPLTFSGDPSETIVPPPSEREFVVGPDTSAAFVLDLFHDPNTAGGGWLILTGSVSLWRGDWVAAAAVSAVPESTSLVLLIAGLAVVGGRCVSSRRGGS